MAGKSSYEGWTLQQVRDAIDAGKPATLTGEGSAAKVFGKIGEDLEKLHEDIGVEVGKVVGGTSWGGPAAAKFKGAVREVSFFLTALRTSINGYPTELDNAGGALKTAQTNIAAYQKEVDDYLDQVSAEGGVPDYAKIDAEARDLLIALANEYRRVIGKLKPIPDKPSAIRPDDEGNKGKGDGEGGDDEGEGDGEGEDDEGEGEKDEKDEKDKKGNGDGSGGGGSGSGSGSGEEGQGEGDSGSGGGGPGGGSGSGKDDEGSGEDDEGEGGSGNGSGGGSGGPTVPNGKLTDGNRTLPDAPYTKGKNGVTGIDVDGDGVPDLGLDGKPLPDAKLVELDGLKGVDVDGDGRPDIGVDGEILPAAPIVQGPDGVLGIDVDGDGRPDVGISGQILPDAPIVTKDGVRGIDVDGDGVPDLGMDRKPLPGATLVTVDGVTGVDVNGDGKPDIGLKGEILEFAPMVSTPQGISGVDVNGDGKPDIAALGGQSAPVKRGAEAISNPELPVRPPTTPTTTTTSLTSAGLGGHMVTYASGAEDTPTVLTRLGPALAGQVGPGFGEPSRFGGTAGIGAQPMAAYGSGAGPRNETAGGRRRTTLVGDDDAWHDDRGANSVLGRPSDDELWED